MPKFYSELQDAHLENLGSDVTPTSAGRIYRNTVDGKAKMDTSAAILAFVTETQTQTLTNKTLTSPVVNSGTINTPTIDVITFDDQASTPSTPSAGLYKVYVKSDGRAYILNPSGVESGLGGGGGITVSWVQQGNTPLDNLLGLIPVFEFEAGLSQELYAIINVPESYAPGSQIRLRVKGISNDTSGNVLFRAQSTLIRSEVDDYDSTTNQRTTTNSAITMSAANDKEPQKIILDITSATGQVNGVSVSASDLLIVRFYRDTDTATGSLYLVKGSEEVTIS
jgi:hypothetical protein